MTKGALSGIANETRTIVATLTEKDAFRKNQGSVPARLTLPPLGPVPRTPQVHCAAPWRPAGTGPSPLLRSASWAWLRYPGLLRPPSALGERLRRPSTCRQLAGPSVFEPVPDEVVPVRGQFKGRILVRHSLADRPGFEAMMKS